MHVFGKKVLPNYPCAVCLEAFPNKCQRNLHQQFHEQGSAKEFRCNLCEETFCKLAQLHGHLGKKHPHQVSKSIYCDICGKGFNAKSKFNKHYNSHLLIDEVDDSGIVWRFQMCANWFSIKLKEQYSIFIYPYFLQKAKNEPYLAKSALIVKGATCF